MPWRTVRDNVAYGMEVKGFPHEKLEQRLQKILAHDLPYVAQTSVHRFPDMVNKLQKAIAVRSPMPSVIGGAPSPSSGHPKARP